MNLDSPGTDPKVVGDRLVGEALRQPVEHVTFARGQCLQPHLSVAHAIIRSFPAGQTAKTFVDRPQQSFFLEWFLDEVDGTGLHCPDGQAHVAVTGHDDYRQVDPFVLKSLLNLKPVHARHADI